MWDNEKVHARFAGMYSWYSCLHGVQTIVQIEIQIGKQCGHGDSLATR